jgi:hypothetical protein
MHITAKSKPIRFKFSAAKALAALHDMTVKRPGIDLHAALKACYFADKAHLNAHGRPVFGARYRAMRFGPVPLEIYEMAKGEALWLAELGIDRMPWRLDGFRLNVEGNAPPDLSALSETDREAVAAGMAQSLGMNFDQRTAATHGADWQAAQLGRMAYEDMIAEGPEKAELVAYLREAAPHMRL